MEFFTSLLTNLVLPVIIISASFGLVFVYGFKSQPSQPDFKGFSFNEEEEKPKSKKLKPKKTPKKPVQNVVQKAPKKTDKVATEIKVAEVPQKSKKELIKAEKTEANLNKEEWTVKVNKKSKKKQEKVESNKKDDTKQNENQEEEDKIDLKTFLEDQKIKLPSNVVIPGNTSEADGNKLTKVDKNSKKIVPKSSKNKTKTSVSEEVVSKDVKVEEENNVVKEDLKKEENKGVKLVVEDGSGDVAKAEKQISEAKNEPDKKKKKKNQKTKDVAIPDKEQAVIQNVEKTEVKIESSVVVPSENGASKKKKKKNKESKSEKELTLQNLEHSELKKPADKKKIEVTKTLPTSQIINSPIDIAIEAPVNKTTGKKTPSEPLTNGVATESSEDWTEAKPIKKKKKILKAL